MTDAEDEFDTWGWVSKVLARQGKIRFTGVGDEHFELISPYTEEQLVRDCTMLSNLISSWLDEESSRNG
jgi:hypothetical protein